MQNIWMICTPSRAFQPALHGGRQRRLMLALYACSLLALAIKDEGGGGGGGGRNWTPFRAVERSLAETNRVVRGVGDAIAVGAGGTIRFLGDSVQGVGSNLEELGQTVAGKDDEHDGSADVSASNAARRLVSRPIRMLSQAFRSTGEMVNMLGDTTERLASGTFSILPDTVQVLQSSVRSVGDALGEGEEDERDNGAAPSAAAAELGLGGTELSTGGASLETAALGANPSAAEAATAVAAARPRSRLLNKWRGWANGLGEPLASPHAALALLAAAALAPSLGRGGQALLVLVLLLYLQSVAAYHATVQQQRIERHTLRALSAGRQLAGRHESAAWLNALLASGWATTLAPIVEQNLRDEIAATLEALPLPRSLREVRLTQLSLGAQPPLLRAIATAPLPRGAPFAHGGCEAQLSLQWDDSDASATFGFVLANVASQPRLRFGRLTLRGTLHVQWEWLPFPRFGYPHVGRVRLCFVAPPTADASFEPLGGVDVTQLPGLGHWLRFVLKDSVNSLATHPNWLETDLSLARAAPQPPSQPSSPPSPPSPSSSAPSAPSPLVLHRQLLDDTGPSLADLEPGVVPDLGGLPGLRRTSAETAATGSGGDP